MNRSNNVPELNDLPDLIRDAFDASPGPDTLRLQQIRRQLDHTGSGTRSQKQPNTLPWWVVLLLSGSFAVAAWWAGERWLLPQQQALPAAINGNMPGETDNELNQPLEQPAEATINATENPVIYQREAR